MFIRTQDKIFDLEKLKSRYEKFEWEGNRLYLIDGFTNTSLKVINQAETIKELCDAFVLVAEDYDYFQTSRKIHRTWTLDDLVDAEDQAKAIGKGISRIIYGAILTDNGLIFVAKLNDKNVLELL